MITVACDIYSVREQHEATDFDNHSLSCDIVNSHLRPTTARFDACRKHKAASYKVLVGSKSELRYYCKLVDKIVSFVLHSSSYVIDAIRRFCKEKIVPYHAIFSLRSSFRGLSSNDAPLLQ